MPRIDAATVAEHRSRQHAALLDAAEELLVESGYEGLTFAALGARTGLARNSVYRYFSGREDIVAQVCERELPDWLETLRLELAAGDDRESRVEAFVTVQLRLIAGRRRELIEVLSQASLGPTARSRIAAMHYAPAEVLAESLAADGHPDPTVVAQLVQGLVNSAVRMLHHSDMTLEQVTAATADGARRTVV
ncbi:MAG: TetR/AcrR family transcriptional regulator [Solirubrobacteraceae bacterium]